ncbi:MAG: hypothetical protein WD607_00865 [Candidatus Paceibacterota bacterium]
MKKLLSRFLFASLVIVILAVIFLQSKNTVIATKSYMNLKTIMNIAVAQEEDPNFTHHFCWICYNPYQQYTIQVDCQSTGTPGCYWAPCGYNYGCENV